MGLPKNLNDSHNMLKKFSSCINLHSMGDFLTWLLGHKMECFHIYLVKNIFIIFLACDPTYKKGGQHAILELLYNCKHKRWPHIPFTIKAFPFPCMFFYRIPFSH